MEVVEKVLIFFLPYFGRKIQFKMEVVEESVLIFFIFGHIFGGKIEFQMEVMEKSVKIDFFPYFW